MSVLECLLLGKTEEIDLFMTTVLVQDGLKGVMERGKGFEMGKDGSGSTKVN